MYELDEVRPFTVTDSSSEARLNGFCEFDKVTVRERVSRRVKLEGGMVEVQRICRAEVQCDEDGLQTAGTIRKRISLRDASA